LLWDSAVIKRVRAWVYGNIGAPLQGKFFRKAVSAVMDDLELFNSIIEQLTPNLVDDNSLITFIVS
jgi:hypothetical protein